MKKNKSKRAWYAFLKRTRKTKKIVLDTGVIVERSSIGGVENIFVIDPEFVEPDKGFSFFISEHPVT